jgi:hypothetical protein
MSGLSRFVLVAALLVAGGCSATATSPTPAGPLRFTLQAAPTFSGLDGGVFTAHVENIGQAAVDLTFPSSCQIVPYFTPRNGTPTPPSPGPVCAAVITRQTLQPGQSFSQVFMVKAGSPQSPYIILPPGDYTIVARLEDSTYRLSSDPLAFSVR